MTIPDPTRDELLDLLWSINEGNSSPGDVARLEELVELHPGAVSLYARYSAMCGLISWERKSSLAVKSKSGADLPPDPSIVKPADDDLEIWRFGDSAISDRPPLSSLPAPLSSPFVGGPVFSYMVASVILCLMLLGAWAYKINYDRDIFIFTADSRGSTTSGPLDQQELVFVGRVTGMKDCRWADPDTRTIVGASVPLDRGYSLASGLMEITYKSGAKVILEGPCAYKVESSAGGFLERGKLTARVETKSTGFRVQRSEVGNQKSPNPQSLIPNPFVVTTPTAVVTDLGTEFGVEVNESGDTTSHVFQGSVRVQANLHSPASGRGAGGEGGMILRENEMIRVSRVRAGTHQDKTTAGNTGLASGTLRFTHPATPPKFVRQMPRVATTNGSMPAMDSAEFAWKYEMDVDPAAQDLDANPGPDWKLLRGAVQVNGGGTATLAAAGESMGCLVSGGPGDPEHATGHVWNNINQDTGFTVELRVKVVGTVEWYGHNLGLYLLAVDSTAEKSSIVAVTKESTLWDTQSKYLIDNNRNDDDFHVFRIAREPGGDKYHVWRDGVLVRLSEGFQLTGWNRVQFGDMVLGSGPNEVDYVRITAGAHAPPKHTPAAHAPDGADKTKEKPPMEH
ncbi:MAG: hypothetical protein JW959_08450 [Pirellulales bacterium]|nr:hypothetical protein [Pirellulales bacterium]